MAQALFSSFKIYGKCCNWLYNAHREMRNKIAPIESPKRKFSCVTVRIGGCCWCILLDFKPISIASCLRNFERTFRHKYNCDDRWKNTSRNVEVEEIFFPRLIDAFEFVWLFVLMLTLVRNAHTFTFCFNAWAHPNLLVRIFYLIDDGVAVAAVAYAKKWKTSREEKSAIE